MARVPHCFVGLRLSVAKYDNIQLELKVALLACLWVDINAHVTALPPVGIVYSAQSKHLG
jgi:hypothetical protein